MAIVDTDATFEVPSGLVDRIWAGDSAAWGPGDDDPEDRLGWLDLPERAAAGARPVEEFASQVRAEGFEAVALLGMGGSSLAPAVFASVLGGGAGWPRLVVCDSTHPQQVRAWRELLPLERSLFVVSSKSGSTVETMSLYRYFRALAPDAGRFVAITDPDTSLHRLAAEQRFRAIFPSPPDVGGRFSALSAFGLVPAALVGIDPSLLLGPAAEMVAACKPDGPDNPALHLGAAIAQLARAGRDKLTFFASAPLRPFGDWLEQLIAESTGKRGTGIVPVVGEPPAGAEDYGNDRAFVALRLPGNPVEIPAGAGAPLIEIEMADPTHLGAHMFLWEFATAVAGSILGINAFDQPDVEAAKLAARSALEAEEAPDWPEEDPEKLFSDVSPGELGCLLAFVPYGSGASGALAAGRRKLVTERGIATMAGFGPRYLHSSGQLHKGGPSGIHALVILDPPGRDEPIPASAHGFARLVAAQAAGDARALEQANRRVGRTTWKVFQEWARS